jgi:DNA-binding NtrC family response regulator
VTALVVDDDVELLESITSLASTAGLQVSAASTWDEGLIAFQALSPSVVVADYNMPGSRHGLRLLLEMARLRPSVRLVLMSAYLNEDDLSEVRKFEFIDAAFRKIDPVTTARAILEEIRRANEASQVSTDWVALAKAAMSTRNVSEDDMEKLDDFLRAHRLPDMSGES